EPVGRARVLRVAARGVAGRDVHPADRVDHRRRGRARHVAVARMAGRSRRFAHPLSPFTASTLRWSAGRRQVAQRRPPGEVEFRATGPLAARRPRGRPRGGRPLVERVLLVAVGGAIGSVLRFLTSIAATQWFGAEFPYGTMIANLSGAFVIGLVQQIGTESL